MTCQVKHFRALVAAEQLPSVLADSTPVLVGIILRFGPCLRRRQSRWLRRLCFCRFRSQRQGRSLWRLPRFGLRPGAAVREAGADAGLHLSTTIAGSRCVRFKNNTKKCLPNQTFPLVDRIKNKKCINAHFQAFYPYKTNVVFVVWFILDNDDGARGRAPPPLYGRPRRGFTRWIPCGCPSMNRKGESDGREVFQGNS